MTSTSNRTLILKYIQAMVHLYGIVPAPLVVTTYNDQNDESISLSCLTPFMKEPHGAAHYAQGEFLHERLVWFQDGELAWLKDRQEGKPFYIPAREELLRHADPSYYQRTPQFERLYRFILTASYLTPRKRWNSPKRSKFIAVIPIFP